MKELRGVGIVFVNNYAGPGLGGGEVHLMHLVRATLAAGMRVEVVCPAGAALAPAARAAGANVLETSMQLRRVPALVRDVRRLVRRSDAALLHAGGYFTSIVARVAVRGTHARLVESAHIMPDAPLTEGASLASVAMRGLIDRLTRNRVAAVAPVSNAIASALLSMGYAREKVHVIHNGIDLAAWRADVSGPVPPLPPGAGPLVGLFARLEPVKGADVFVRAASLIAAERADVRFLVAGDGSQSGVLREMAAASGLGDRILFEHSVPSVAAALATLTVCVVSSRSEGFSLLALEAAALGIPVVASSVGGVPEVVVDGRTGVLVPPGDATSLASAVLGLLEDPERAERLGQSAKDHAEGYTVQGMTGQYLALYREVLASGEAS